MLDAAVVLVIGRFSGVVLFVPLGVVGEGFVLREKETTKRQKKIILNSNYLL